MSDEYSEVTVEGWFSRIGGAIKGVFIGIILFLIAFPVLFWNEGRSVDRYKALAEGSGAVVAVSNEAVDKQNDGKLIHISGSLSSTQTLTDSEFGVVTPGLAFKRKVEVFQWVETVSKQKEKQVGGKEVTKKTYKYTKAWKSSLIKSNEFKVKKGHENPKATLFESKSWTNSDVKLGAYTVPSGLKSSLIHYKDYTPKQELKIPNVWKHAKVQDGKIISSKKGTDPQVGDVRVSFRYAPLNQASLIAKQNGANLEKYATQNDDSIFLSKSGIHSEEAMFKAAEESNATLTWILRLVGFALMFAGIGMILKPLSVLADVLPFLGDLVEAGAGFIAFVVAVVGSSITIAVAWIAYRPLIGVPLLVVALGASFVGYQKVRANRVAKA